MSQPFDRRSPLGIFDSGVGGLTVLRAIHVAAPGESTIYVGDTARVPYGTKSPSAITRNALEIAAFLEAQGVKYLVVACNSASAVAMKALGEQTSLPIKGVIAPGAEAAVAATRSGKIGVIGTRATIGSGAYKAAIRSLEPSMMVFSLACPLFVPLAEEGWTEGGVPEAVALEYLRPLMEAGVDVLVLGCTHYPLLKDTIGRVLGEDVTLIDSAEVTARAVVVDLVRHGMDAPQDANPTSQLYATDLPPDATALASRFLGEPVDEVALLDLASLASTLTTIKGEER
jgi:glutamate racemase